MTLFHIYTGRLISEFRGAFRFLSNFYPCDIEYEGMLYPSVEHAYQAAKAVDPLDRELFTGNISAKGAKRLGRYGTIREDWDSRKLSIMEQLLRTKFALGSDLAKELVFTGSAQLEEGNWWNDTFWGICRGKGENHLGKLLMKIREDLRKSK